MCVAVCVCVLHCGLQAVKKWPTGPLASGRRDNMCAWSHVGWNHSSTCGEHSWPCGVCLLRWRGQGARDCDQPEGLSYAVTTPGPAIHTSVLSVFVSLYRVWDILRQKSLCTGSWTLGKLSKTKGLGHIQAVVNQLPCYLRTEFFPNNSEALLPPLSVLHRE